MPYIRRGKCNYKKGSNGKLTLVGCSKDVATAKKANRALWAAENNQKMIQILREQELRLHW